MKSEFSELIKALVALLLGALGILINMNILFVLALDPELK